MVNIYRYLVLFLFFVVSFEIYSQQQSEFIAAPVYMSMNDIISLAKERSFPALQAKHSFLAAYWQFRFSKAEMLPSMSVSLSLPDFNHSISSLQSYATGEYRFVQSSSMSTGMALSIEQSITATGGTVSLNSSLDRFDQYSPQRVTSYINQPISIILNQPVLGKYNSLKWNKRIEPLKLKLAKIVYLESIQDVVLSAVDLYYEVLISQKKLQIAELNVKNTIKQYAFAKEKFALGSLSDSELTQIELSLRNNQLTLNQFQYDMTESMSKLINFLRLDNSMVIELLSSGKLPNIEIEEKRVYAYALNNSSLRLSSSVLKMQGEAAIDQAKKEKGISADLYLSIGYNKISDNVYESYQNPLGQENIRVGVKIPISDWGVGRGKLAIAKSNANLLQVKSSQDSVELKQMIFLKTKQLRNQKERFLIASQADSAAYRFYLLSNERFQQGKIDVISITSSQIEKDQALIQKIEEEYNFWKIYFWIEKYTLYDFIDEVNILNNFDVLYLKKLIK